VVCRAIYHTLIQRSDSLGHVSAMYKAMARSRAGSMSRGPQVRLSSSRPALDKRHRMSLSQSDLSWRRDTRHVDNSPPPPSKPEQVSPKLPQYYSSAKFGSPAPRAADLPPPGRFLDGAKPPPKESEATASPNGVPTSRLLSQEPSCLATWV
jgi:hypothetical protein